MNPITWVIIIFASIFVLFIIGVFNRMITLRNRVKNAWAQIDVQLKRRSDLIPNLVNTVKGYVKHEQSTLKAITEARAAVMKSHSVKGKAQASNMLSNALKSLFAVAEAYPNLKANENFKMLQEELSGTENKIAYSRQFYNDSVMQYNIKRERFPTNIVANMFGFKKKDSFEATAAERKNVKVEF